MENPLTKKPNPKDLTAVVIASGTPKILKKYLGERLIDHANKFLRKDTAVKLFLDVADDILK